MQIVSVNVAQPVTIDFDGRQSKTGIYKKPVDGKVQVTRLGVAGDTVVDEKVHGGFDQAVYLYHSEDYDWWSEQLGKTLAPGTFGENLTVTGLADRSLVIGDRLRINDIELEITAPRTPCFKLARRMDDPTFPKAFARAARPGAYARVLQEGCLQSGDEIHLEPTTGDFASVREVFVEWHKKDRSPEVLKKALGSPIGRVHKRKIQGWYDQMQQEAQGGLFEP
ncbi:MOSC domain-containing protein [Marinimicrobium sp. C2-29]|uniref:MOSC domain-containing protein n=1 Tax=Marinimicrobium sp. C2-29 TaxID=3139825 RepID=UPI00313863DB